MLPAHFAEQARAIVACGLQAAAGQRAEQGRCAEGNAANHQVYPCSCSGASGHAAADFEAQLFEGFRVEQVVTPTAIQKRQLAALGVAAAEFIEAQQGVYALLLALSNQLMQGAERRLFCGRLAWHAAPAGGYIEQQFGDQALSGLLAQFALGLVFIETAIIYALIVAILIIFVL